VGLADLAHDSGVESGNDYRPDHRRGRGAGRRSGKSDDAVGAARYDHLAGRLSVDLTDSFVAREYIVLDARWSGHDCRSSARDAVP
jgi:hypothetical protein